MKTIHTIDEVIHILEEIIEESKINNSPLGYFATLYKKVTIEVKKGIESNFFEDGPRMERLDVLFASRYLDAYYAYKNNEAVTLSWERAFELSHKYWPIVLQHLLIGINAHISLDLGIAAAQVSKDKGIESLKTDFDKINEILSSLVADVENDLATIWPTLQKILKWTRKVDNFLVDFSMEIARDGAWRFAKEIAHTSEDKVMECIKERDNKVAKNADIITAPGFIPKLILSIIRLGERGSVATKIDELND